MPRPANRFFFSPRRSLCPLCSSLCDLCVTVPLLFSVLLLSSCSHPPSDPSSVVFVIESNPANLDPRFGSDAQSQRLSALLFDGLVERDAEMNLHPDLAESWDTPTPPAQAEKLLDAAGFPRKADGTRLHVTLKISTVEQARLIGAALQDQWKKVGISLEVRPLEIATLFADLAKGSFQISYLRWVGANNDPDVFELVFSSKRIPPDGPNRGRYRSARMDALTDQIRTEMDREKRKQLCHEAQQLAAEDLPYIPLWYPDVVSVHAQRLGDLPLSPTGDYQFLSAP